MSEQTWEVIIRPTVRGFLLTTENLSEVASWCKGVIKDSTILVPTQYGLRTAIPGDIVYKKMNGEVRVDTALTFFTKHRPVPVAV